MPGNLLHATPKSHENASPSRPALTRCCNMSQLGLIEKGILLKMRFDLDQYINLRPVHLFPGTPRSADTLAEQR